mgnify:CR=1 FL=1
MDQKRVSPLDKALYYLGDKLLFANRFGRYSALERTLQASLQLQSGFVLRVFDYGETLEFLLT